MSLAQKYRDEGYKVISPQPGFQDLFVKSSVDVVFGGGVLNAGKSFGAILSVAEPSLDPNFRACFVRRTFGELKMSGGLLDDMDMVYGNVATVTRSENPRIVFPSKASVELRQINDENPKKITESLKGLQADLIYMDELTSYDFFTFKYLLTRNRGKASWTGKFRGTTNPKKNSWVRDFIDWYIDPYGQIYPERSGVIRYFYINGDSIEDVVWGDTKKEVYQKCKGDIDKKLKAIGGKFSYENMIKSFTFYLGKMSENIASLSGNMDYIGSVAASGGKQAKQLIEGSWNVDVDEDDDAPIKSSVARNIKNVSPQTNGDLWITADLAESGKDNMLVLVWDGFHVIDMKILKKSTPRENAQLLINTAIQYNIADSHIVFDGNNNSYILGIIPDAIPFVSYKRAFGVYGRGYRTVKDECYHRLIYHVNKGTMSFDKKVLERRYEHQRIKDGMSVLEEFVDECCVVRMEEGQYGKKTLWDKKKMNMMLGRGRSMDLLDAVAMRFYPVLKYVLSEERFNSAQYAQSSSETNEEIYEDSFWA